MARKKKTDNIEYEAVPMRDPNKNDEKEEENEESVGLKAKMNLRNGCTVIIGSIIGSGIFVSPTGVLKSTGSINMALLIWLLSGFYSMIGALCYAELGCMIHKSGADYAYIMIAFGSFPAFLRLWVECMVVRPCSIAIVALTFAKYATKPLFPECDPPDMTVRLLAAFCICTIAFINCWEVKWALFLQDIFTYAKLFALIIIIITGVIQLGRGKVENFTWENTETDVTKIALSFYSGLFAYYGWNFLNFVIEELQDPVKNLPKAIAISITGVTFIYFFANVAFYTTLNISEVLGSEAVAVTFAERLYGYFAFLIPIFVAMSTFGSVNGILMTASRLFYSGACEGQMPSSLCMVNTQKSTPVPAVLAVGIMSLCYLCSSDVFVLINYVGLATWGSIGLGVSCLPYLRWKHPEWQRPIKVHLVFPIFYILATIFIIALPAYVNPMETLYGILIIASAFPVYYVFIVWKNKPQCLETIFNDGTIFLQKMFIVMSPEKK